MLVFETLLGLLLGAPLPSELILALFVAPVLLDAADTSLRDLRANTGPVGSLVVVAVGLTTAAVTARLLLPEFPWAAIALGALVAPPDNGSTSSWGCVALTCRAECGEQGWPENHAPPAATVNHIWNACF